MSNLEQVFAQFQIGRPSQIAGILNLTPDSFSDGGLYTSLDSALAQARAMQEAGAAMLDLGAESTRPGSVPVSSQEELDRLLPVIEALGRATDLPFSVDTFKARTAAGVIAAGASLINDITGLFADPEMAEVIASGRAGLILMFNPCILRPWHQASQNFRQFAPDGSFTSSEIDFARNLPVTEQMVFFFEKALTKAQAAGIPSDRIWLDPGIGFGLTAQENWTLLHSVDLIHNLGYPAYFGVSRKRFLAATLAKGQGSESGQSDQRDLATAAITTYLAGQGVELLRVHNPAANYPALLIGRELGRSRARQAGQIEADQDQIFGQYKN